MAQSAGPVARFLAGIVLTALGFFLAFTLGKPLRDQSLASGSWPTTEGRITRSELVRTVSKGTAMYTADIGYTYDLDGRSFEGERVWFGDDYRSSNAAEFRRVVAAYPVDRQVRVHYDPAAPEASVLEPGATWSGSLLYFAGLGTLALGGILVLSCILPLVIAVALVGPSGRGSDPELQGFSRPPPRPLTNPPAAGRTNPESPEDDGITIS